MSDTKGDGSSEGVPCFGPRPGRASRHVQVPAPADFTKWARLDRWHIAEGAMLILGFEPPFDVKKADWGHRLPSTKGFDDINETALRSDGFKAEGYWVSPRYFLAWAHEKGYRVPKKLQEAVNQFHPTGEDRPQSGADGAKWPWGNYETELLGHLAAAAERLWKNYDPSDPRTAPTNRQVIKWLRERGVTKRTAEVMATILRADGLPTGPRK